jgi:hypothetical protein
MGRVLEVTMAATPAPETTAGRKRLGAQGKAIPSKSGGAPRFPIPNVAYLDKAIKAVGRAKGDHAVVRRYIMRRARELGATSHIPDNWNSDGSIGGSSSG